MNHKYLFFILLLAICLIMPYSNRALAETMSSDVFIPTHYLSLDDDIDPPDITVTSPAPADYPYTDSLTFDFHAVDVGNAGLKEIWADLDDDVISNGQVIELISIPLGEHTFTVNALDNAGNQSQVAFNFRVIAYPQDLCEIVAYFYAHGGIDEDGIQNSLIRKMEAFITLMENGQTCSAANKLLDFINEANAQEGKHITTEASDLLEADGEWLLQPYSICFNANPNLIFLPVALR